MSRFVKEEVQNIEISGIRKFNQIASEVPGVVKLTIGELDIYSPENVKQAAIKAIEKNLTKYTKNKGIELLRKKIANKYSHYSREEVILTVGTTEGLSIVLKSIISEGDEVIIPTPGYVGYAPLITLEKGIVKEIDTTISNFKITRESLINAYTNNTKAMIITSPNNPTGSVLSDEEMDIIKDFVLEKDILLISDEIYSEIVFEKEHKSFGSFKELKNNLVVLNGFSKSHAMTGYRIGYVLSDIELINEFVKVHQYSVTSTSTISQYAALEAIKGEYKDVVEILSKRRSYVLNQLNEIGLPYIPTDGAFYVFIDVSKYDMSSEEYCLKLLHEYKVALIPGEYFLGNHKNYVRLSFAAKLEDIEFALAQMKELDSKI